MPAIANRYAKALVDVSFKLNHHEQVAQELLQFEDLLARQKELVHFYSNPAIAVAKKKAATQEILAKLAFGPTTSNFLLVLIDNHRMGGFAEIRKAFQHELNNRLGVTQAEVTTATELGRGDTPEVGGQACGADRQEGGLEVCKRSWPDWRRGHAHWRHDLRRLHPPAAQFDEIPSELRLGAPNSRRK